MMDLMTTRARAREAADLWRTLLLGEHRATYIEHILEGMQAALELEWDDWVHATHRAMVDFIDSERFLDVAEKYGDSPHIPTRLTFLAMSRMDLIFEQVFSARWNTLIWAVVMRRFTGYRNQLRGAAESILLNTARMVHAMVSSIPQPPPPKNTPKIRRRRGSALVDDDETR